MYIQYISTAVGEGGDGHVSPSPISTDISYVVVIDTELNLTKAVVVIIVAFRDVYSLPLHLFSYSASKNTGTRFCK